MSSLEPLPRSSEVVSPGLGAGQGLGRAFELKFLLNAAQAGWIERWALEHLLPDAHGEQGRYNVTSLYCDTAGLDVFHRSPGFKRSKYRLRRYGIDERIYLERKTKRGDRVRKKRFEVRHDELHLLAAPIAPEQWSGRWFLERIHRRGLQPTCHIAYQRQAFFGMAGEHPIRLTLDRHLLGVPARDWHVPTAPQGLDLLPEGVLLELKFHLHMPTLFQELLPHLPEQPAHVSKYRRCVELCGLARQNLGRTG